MRELEASLQQFGEFVLKAQLMKASAAPYCVRWVRQFLTRPAANEPLADQVRRFCEELERQGACEEWQVRQAEHIWRCDSASRAAHKIRRCAPSCSSAARCLG